MPSILWGDFYMDQILESWNLVAPAWKDFIEQISDKSLLEVTEYRNSRGDHFQNARSDILTHVINHGTHHRGQIMIYMKKRLPAIQSLDYILFLRDTTSK